MPDAPWGAYPGNTLVDVGSGIGVVHNAYMLEHTQKTIVRGPFRSFPASLGLGERHLASKPPFFVDHRTADVLGERLTSFAARRSWRSLPGLLPPALTG